MADFAAPTPQLAVLKAAIDGYLTRDITKSDSFISKNLTFRTFPKHPDHPDETKEEHTKKYAPIFASFSDVKLKTHEVIEAPGKVVIHVTVIFTTTDGATVDYDTVGIFSFVEEDGRLKIHEVKNFCDPEKHNNLHATAAKLIGGLAL